MPPARAIQSSAAIFRAALLAATLVAAPAIPAAHANWLTKILHEAGEAGALVGRHGPGALERGARHVRSLPKPANGAAALAAHVTPEGHWKFANRAGETFTAGTPDELKRVATVLAPEATADGRIALYISEDSVFAWRQYLKGLPAGAELHVVAGKTSYPMRSRTVAGSERLYATVKPNLVVELNEKRLFDEAVWQLARPLDRSSIRVLALEPGGPEVLSRLPKLERNTKRAAVDAIDPYKLPAALATLKGQTALLTGRVEGGFLHFRTGSGAEKPLLLKDLTAAAEAADVNLVILHSAAPRQPGGRNWLWQKVAVAGLDDALKRATVSDFLNALGASRGELVVSARSESPARITLSAIPSGGAASQLTGALGDWAREITGNITGNIVTGALEAHMRSSERQSEIDARLIPFLPATLQIAYIAALIAGIVGITHAWSWWNRIWPPERREEYGGAFGFHSARAVKGLAFLLLFLPIAGPFALLASLIAQAWGIARLPLRLIRWLTGKGRSAPAQ